MSEQNESFFNNKPSFQDRGDACQTISCTCQNRKKNLYNVNNILNTEQTEKRWLYWQAKRRKVYQHLTAVLNRPVGDLLMNLGDYMFYINEEKRIFEYVNVPLKFDKYRGNPAFWKTPVGLIDRCNPKLDPVYLTTMTSIEKNMLAPVPDYYKPRSNVQRTIYETTRNIYQKWKSNPYRYEQIKKISHKLSLITPHRPFTTNLLLSAVGLYNVVLVNKSVQNQIQYIATIYDELNYKPLLHTSSQSSVTSDSNSEKAFILNDIYIGPHTTDIGVRKVYLVFDYEITSKPFVLNLKFTNCGNVTLRFNFKKIVTLKVLRNIIKDDKTRVSAFYFNKNEVIVTPGGVTSIPVWFVSKEPGKFSEKWEVNVIPKFIDKPIYLIFLGVATKKKCEDLAISIKQKISTRAKNQIVEDVINDLVKTFNFCKKQPKENYVFCEKEIFESVNQDQNIFDIHPKYVYNKEVVDVLKQFYLEVKRDEHSEEWDYSVTNLKKITRERDLMDYVDGLFALKIKAEEERKKQAEEKKIEDLKRLEAEKNWSPGSPSKGDKKDKKGSKKDKDSKKGSKKDISSKKDKHSKGSQKDKSPKKKAKLDQEPIEVLLDLKPMRYKNLSLILQFLERPTTVPNTDRLKYQQAFSVIQAYFTKISIELSYLDDDYKTYLYTKQKTVNMNKNWCHHIPDRRIYETFDDIFISKSKRIFPSTESASKNLPKSKLLKDIPIEDCETVYKTYFNKQLPSDKGKHTKKGDKDSQKSKSPKKEKNSKASKGKSDKTSKSEKSKKGKVRDEEIVTFDPFAEKFEVPEMVSTEPSQDSLDKNSKMSSEEFIKKTSYASMDELIQYKTEMYHTIYFNLTEGIDALVDTLETCKETLTPSRILKDIQNIWKPHDEKCIYEPKPEKNLDVLFSNKNFNDEQENKEKTIFIDKLLDQHWRQNLQTKQYLIEGLTKATKNEEEPKHIFSFLLTKQIDYVESKETLKSEEELSYDEEKIPQTLKEDKSVDIMMLSDNSSDINKVEMTKVQKTESVKSLTPSTSKSSDVFYYLDDDEALEEDSQFDNLKIIYQEIKYIDD